MGASCLDMCSLIVVTLFVFLISCLALVALLLLVNWCVAFVFGVC